MAPTYKSSIRSRYDGTHLNILKFIREFTFQCVIALFSELIDQEIDAELEMSDLTSTSEALIFPTNIHDAPRLVRF